MQLYVIGNTNGNDAKEDEHQQVAHAQIGKMGGIKEAEQHAQDTNKNHFQTAEENKRHSDGTCQAGGQGDGPFHGAELHPPLRTGTTRPQTGLSVVGTVGKVEKVVDKISIHLHQQCEQKAEGC